MAKARLKKKRKKKRKQRERQREEKRSDLSPVGPIHAKRERDPKAWR